MIKRGQLSLNFAVLFSIILIAVIIAVGFYVIRYFLELKDCGMIGTFYENLQDEVDKAWQREETAFDFRVELPASISHVCVADFDKSLNNPNIKERSIFNELKRNIITGNNIFLYPREKSCGLFAREIKHLDVEKITDEKNPYCFENGANIRISKNIEDRDVNLG